ncbi:hypothetical protein KCMC57_up45410 [Kitasatospora sp. CMC57]|uniref:Uncharacterized protein n=1 Tax=Kitasatospora sp. CMC57 TaxID=3231513 RepID=A0AB33JYA8_9ACTN
MSGLVTDASGNSWSCGPAAPSTTPSPPRTTAAAAVGTGQSSIIRKLCMGPTLVSRTVAPECRACLECAPSQ